MVKVQGGKEKDTNPAGPLDVEIILSRFDDHPWWDTDELSRNSRFPKLARLT